MSSYAGYDASQKWAGQQFTQQVSTCNMIAQRATPPYTERRAAPEFILNAFSYANLDILSYTIGNIISCIFKFNNFNCLNTLSSFGLPKLTSFLVLFRLCECTVGQKGERGSPPRPLHCFSAI